MTTAVTPHPFGMTWLTSTRLTRTRSPVLRSAARPALAGMTWGLASILSHGRTSILAGHPGASQITATTRPTIPTRKEGTGCERIRRLGACD